MPSFAPLFLYRTGVEQPIGLFDLERKNIKRGDGVLGASDSSDYQDGAQANWRP
jgi:hypothetical protein